MEKKISPTPKVTYLVSVKSKTSNGEGKIYVVSSTSLNSFVENNLTSDSVILIDTISTYGIDM